jgi:hypothetical protein
VRAFATFPRFASFWRHDLCETRLRTQQSSWEGDGTVIDAAVCDMWRLGIDDHARRCRLQV